MNMCEWGRGEGSRPIFGGISLWTFTSSTQNGLFYVTCAFFKIVTVARQIFLKCQHHGAQPFHFFEVTAFLVCSLVF